MEHYDVRDLEAEGPSEIERMLRDDIKEKKVAGYGARHMAPKKHGLRRPMLTTVDYLKGKEKTNYIYGEVKTMSLNELIMPYNDFIKLDKAIKKKTLQEYVNLHSSEMIAAAWGGDKSRLYSQAKVLNVPLRKSTAYFSNTAASSTSTATIVAPPPVTHTTPVVEPYIQEKLTEEPKPHKSFKDSIMPYDEFISIEDRDEKREKLNYWLEIFGAKEIRIAWGADWRFYEQVKRLGANYEKTDAAKKREVTSRRSKEKSEVRDMLFNKRNQEPVPEKAPIQLPVVPAPKEQPIANMSMKQILKKFMLEKMDECAMTVAVGPTVFTGERIGRYLENARLQVESGKEYEFIFFMMEIDEKPREKKEE